MRAGLMKNRDRLSMCREGDKGDGKEAREVW